MYKHTKSYKKPRLKIIRPSHDSILRKSLECPVLAKQFFDANLPEDVRSIIDTNNLIIEKESFVDENLNKKEGEEIMGSYAQNLLDKMVDKVWEAAIGQGIEQGIEQERYVVIKNMLKKHLDKNLISEIANVSVETIDNIARDQTPHVC